MVGSEKHFFKVSDDTMDKRYPSTGSFLRDTFNRAENG